MTIKVKCQCGRSYAVPESFSGKKARCKVCGRKLTVPPISETERTASDRLGSESIAESEGSLRSETESAMEDATTHGRELSDSDGGDVYRLASFDAPSSKASGEHTPDSGHLVTTAGPALKHYEADRAKLTAGQACILTGFRSHAVAFATDGLYVLHVAKHPIAQVAGIAAAPIGFVLGICLYGIALVLPPISTILAVFLAGGFFNLIAFPVLGAVDMYRTVSAKTGAWFIESRCNGDVAELRHQFQWKRIEIGKFEFASAAQLVELTLPVGEETKKVYRIVINTGRTTKVWRQVPDKASPDVNRFIAAARAMLGNPVWELPFASRQFDASEDG